MIPIALDIEIQPEPTILLILQLAILASDVYFEWVNLNPFGRNDLSLKITFVPPSLQVKRRLMVKVVKLDEIFWARDEQGAKKLPENQEKLIVVGNL